MSFAERRVARVSGLDDARALAKLGASGLGKLQAEQERQKERTINELGKKNALNSLEKPKEIYVTGDPFSVENDILTPTFKLKRNVGKKVYQDQINAMYEALAARGL